MRLIDADALWMDVIRSVDYCDDILEFIERQPTVEQQPHWIPCSERLPEELVPVNITWVNHEPESYYEDIKDKPFSATGIYYRSKWWWYSATAEDVLAEYGRSEFDRVSDSVEIIAWKPLPLPYQEEGESE